jgi:hypothetical protein
MAGKRISADKGIKKYPTAEWPLTLGAKALGSFESLLGTA